jgi:monooxygenase
VRIGGTWDLFRYPGIRSDSDMFTFGYQFRPWIGLQLLADGSSIRNHIQATAREYGVADKIHFGVQATQANWKAASVAGSSRATRSQRRDEGVQREVPGQLHGLLQL